MDDTAATRLVVIAKACVPGRVKTRLTPPLSPEDAAGLAQVSLDQTLETVRGVARVQRVLLLDGDAAGLRTDGFRIARQVSGGLDERIAAAFDDAPGRVLLIGMDTPQVTTEELQAVVDDSASDAWFGPATDGGFWALGLASARGDLVRGVPMSRSDTGALQLDRLRGAGLRTRVLRDLVDVDRFEDVLSVAAAVPGTPFARAADALAAAVQLLAR